MKTRAKKLLSVTIVFVMLFAAVSAFSVSAKDTVNETVKVIIKNTNFSASDGAAWDNVLFNGSVALSADDTMMSVIVKTAEQNGYSIDISKGYITEVNGLEEYANNGSGGWMVSLNDWFTTDSAQNYTVANGGLCAGDEIVVMYSNNWGADCGSLYGNFDTSLTALTAEGGLLAEDFSSSEHTYTLLIKDASADVTVIPEAFNKNYQVRTYLNEYKPETNSAETGYKRSVRVASGDTLYIGVGNPAWPTMNSWAGTADETVYTVNVKYVQNGDVNYDGAVDVKDVTAVQRYLAEFDDFTAAQKELADLNGDNKIKIGDATDIQRIIAEMN